MNFKLRKQLCRGMLVGKYKGIVLKTLVFSFFQILDMQIQQLSKQQRRISIESYNYHILF